MRALILLSVALAAPVAAQSPTTEVSLRHQLRIDPDDHTALVNLAGLYVRTGRTAKAHRLYRALLGMENVALERAGGEPVWSHRLAQDAIRANPLQAKLELSAR